MPLVGNHRYRMSNDDECPILIAKKSNGRIALSMSYFRISDFGSSFLSLELCGLMLRIGALIPPGSGEFGIEVAPVESKES
mmetsp:Transcript_44958/g.119619  ORF Transcript_44958/g.119619 Transcript_44958/m.119619 type:complete len:81 (-) Transcript_44958:53-295(-)